MRLKLASALVTIGLLASSMTPASAVFGLSKCEKVKKQVVTVEKQINNNSNFNKYNKSNIKLIKSLKILAD